MDLDKERWRNDNTSKFDNKSEFDDEAQHPKLILQKDVKRLPRSPQGRT
jgi:hypothetical protein